MVMSVPIGGTAMHLDIACPELAVDTHFGIEEVGTGIEVAKTGMNNFDGMTLWNSKMREESLLPYEVH